MATITSTTFCDDDCPGHVTVTDIGNRRVALTDNPAAPLALVDNEEES